MHMFQILNKTAPYIFDWKRILLRFFIVGFMVAFSLIVFQPFGTARSQFSYKTLFLSGYGWVIFVVGSLMYLLFPKLFPRFFQEDQWKLWKEMLFLLFSLTIIFFVCYLHGRLWFGYSISMIDFFSFLPAPLTISIFPIAVITLLQYIYYLRQHQGVAQSFNDQIAASPPPAPKKETLLTFKDENEKEDFSLPENQLLFIKAANNYVEITYQATDQIKKHLLRNRLNAIEQQLPQKNIVRCHRSYLVNLDKVGRITGNAQGYKIHFPFTSEYVVPVSRTKGKALLDLIGQ